MLLLPIVVTSASVFILLIVFLFFFMTLFHHAIGAAHAGWRGTVQRIAQHTLRKMTELYGTDPKELKAVVGPCISLKNFEVGQEVYDAFSAAGFPMERIARMYEKWHIDLPLCNQLQLEELWCANS